MNIRFHASALLVAGLMSIAYATTAAGNVDSGIFKPHIDVLHKTSGGELASQLKLEIGPKDFESHENKLWLGWAYCIAGIEGDLVHVWDNSLDCEPSFIKANAGVFWKLKEYFEASSLPQDPNDVKDNVKKYDYGRIYLTAHGQGETDDNADNLNIADGGSFTYTTGSAFRNSIFAPPSFGVAYEYVNPERAVARDAIAADDSAFPRLRAFALWSWAFGEKFASGVPIVKNCQLQIRYHYAKEFNQPAAWIAAGYDEYDQFDASIRYLFEAPKRDGFGLREIYAGYSTGRQIAHAQDDDRILIGVLLQ